MQNVIPYASNLACEDYGPSQNVYLNEKRAKISKKQGVGQAWEGTLNSTYNEK